MLHHDVMIPVEDLFYVVSRGSHSDICILTCSHSGECQEILQFSVHAWKQLYWSATESCMHACMHACESDVSRCWSQCPPPLSSSVVCSLHFPPVFRIPLFSSTYSNSFKGFHECSTKMVVNLMIFRKQGDNSKCMKYCKITIDETQKREFRLTFI